ncbi:MAG: quinonprotein alcohol dehydrogenase [Planctomycetes bacterium]|nr:quinonprotein alcohol dehydrogenase [Planctomycetota bacterium]
MRFPSAIGALVGLAAIGIPNALVAEGHWNQFRGPQGDGQAPAASTATTWSESEHVRWKTAIPGKAWSSPVVWNDSIWLTSATEDGKELSALRINAATGAIEHNVVVFRIEKPMFCYPFNSYASSTPVIEEGRLWVHYGSAGTACLDTETGAAIWARQDLPCDHHRGPGSSPIVFQDLLILTFDGFDQQYVTALDKRTGTTVWRTDRTIDYGTDDGDMKKAYSTPTVLEHAGRWQLVSPSAVATIAYDPFRGGEIWKVYHGGFNAAARPLYSHGTVIICTQGGDKQVAIRPDGEGDVTKTHVAWTNSKGTPTRPSQLIMGDALFMISDTGIVSCIDARTGGPIWTDRFEGRFSASPIRAGGHILFFDEDGASHVIEANAAAFRHVATNRLDDGCMASPAVHGDALIVRTKTRLYRIEAAMGH